MKFNWNSNLLVGLLLAVAFSLIVSIGFTGCAGNQGKLVTVHQRIEAACVSAGTAYGVIAEVNKLKPLKASQQAQVLKAKVKVDARCKLGPGEDYPYTLSDALLTELEGAATTLKTVEGEVK